MIAYPTSLPTDAVMIVVSKLRGNEVPLGQLGQAAWNLQGFAMSQLGGLNTSAAALDKWDECKLADTLESAAKSYSTGDYSPLFAIPWNVVLPVLLNLLQKWLVK